MNSHINNIGVTSLTGAATTNNIGTNAAFASTNTMGSINAATTVTAYGGNSTMAVVNNASSLGSVNASVASSNLVGATSGTGGGASVVLSGAAPTANTTQYTVDGAGHIIANTVNGTTPATASTAAFVLSNGYGANHGMIVTEGQTTVSGGTHSTSMTLNDNGATFRNQYGTAATVSGVADGKARYDAVNFGQLRDVYGGVAAASALAGIPNPAPGKSFVIGMGYGNFMSTSAFAFGAKAALTKNLMVQFGVGFSPNNNQTYSAGLGWSF